MSEEMIGDDMKLVIPEERGILLIKRPEGADDQEALIQMKMLAEEVADIAGMYVLIVSVSDLDDIQFLDEEAMLEHGWIREESVIMHRRSDFDDVVKAIGDDAYDRAAFKVLWEGTGDADALFNGLDVEEE